MKFLKKIVKNLFLSSDFSKNFQSLPQPLPTAYKKTSSTLEETFLYLTRNINLETNCAVGPKLCPEQRNTDADEPENLCRLQQTDVLIAAKAEFLATTNDKLVSYCEDGVWTEPSHECECPETWDRRWGKVKYFEFTDYQCALLSVADEISISESTIGGNTQFEQASIEQRDDDETATRPSENSEESSSGFTNKVVLTTCGFIPAIFYNL